MEVRALICECAISGVLPPGAVKGSTDALIASGAPLETVPDLCALAARKDPRLKGWAALPGLEIHACHARAVKALFALGQAPLDDTRVKFIDLRGASPADHPESQPLEQMAQHLHAPANGRWVPWFPVIDEARCSQCQQCLGFCLFGVYALSPDGKIVVQNPEACKTNCPACARICPQVAIIFPKHNEAPINGAEIADENLEQARVKADLQKILGSDIYGALAERRKKAQQRQLLRRQAQLANTERQAHAAGANPIQFRPRNLNPDPPASL